MVNSINSSIDVIQSLLLSVLYDFAYVAEWDPYVHDLAQICWVGYVPCSPCKTSRNGRATVREEVDDFNLGMYIFDHRDLSESVPAW